MPPSSPTPRLRILNAEPDGYCDEARAVLERCGELVAKSLSREALLQEVADADVLIVRLAHEVDAELLAAGRRLKAVVTATTGLDHVDLEEARRRGVAVISLRGESEFLRSVPATAEHTWALLLALTRRIVAARHAVTLGRWDRDALRGHDLAGRRLGLLGLGRIGRLVAGYGRAFAMDVRAFDPHAPDGLDGVARAASLPALLAESDVLSIHVPLDATTEGLVGAAELAALPPGALLVNTSRGAVVDEAALLEALRGGRLAGAALDVIPGEREAGRRAASPLIAYAAERENLLITPHIGGATYESMARTEVFVAQKLEMFLHALAEESEEHR